MKLKFGLSLALLVGVALTFNACRKSGSNPTGPALTPKAVSSQIALNISQTLYGGFGAFSLNSGLNAPNSLGVIHHSRIGLNDLNDDPLCGLVADTTLNYTLTTDSGAASVKGHLKFAFSCDNGLFSGFNVKTDLQVTESTPNVSLAYTLSEDLTLLSLDPSNVNSTFSLNGPLSETAIVQHKTGSKGTDNDSFSYVFKSLIITSSGDIGSGSATFATKGSGPAGSWDYTGSITFLPNNLVQIVINGTTYKIDLQTGQVLNS